MEYLGQVLGSELDANFELVGYWATSDGGITWEPTDGPEFGAGAELPRRRCRGRRLPG